MTRPNTLIIEDNLFLIKVLKNLLLYQTGRLKIAQTVEEAEAILSKETFELILSDFHLGQNNSMPILKNISELQKKQMLVFMSSDIKSLNKVKRKFSHNQYWAFVNKNEGDWLVRIQDSINNLLLNHNLGIMV